MDYDLYRGAAAPGKHVMYWALVFQQDRPLPRFVLVAIPSQACDVEVKKNSPAIDLVNEPRRQISRAGPPGRGIERYAVIRVRGNQEITKRLECSRKLLK